MGFYNFGNTLPGYGFHHPMFAIFIAQGINLDDQKGSGDDDYPQAGKGIDAHDVHKDKEYQKGDGTTTQIPDILRF